MAEKETKKTVAKKAAPKKTVEVVKKATPKTKSIKMEDLKEAVVAVEVTNQATGEVVVNNNTPKKKVKDSLGRLYSTGKRKDACARVWIKSGSGKVIINGKELEKYFVRPVLRMIINQPFVLTNRVGQYDVMCTVSGGGLSGQAGALRHGISRCLNEFEPELRSVLKQAGFLTRDPRAVERKKYGLAKARKRFQFSKR